MNYFVDPADNTTPAYDENPEDAVSAFYNGVMAAVVWLDLEQEGSITDLARSLVQKAEWTPRHDLILGQAGLDGLSKYTDEPLMLMESIRSRGREALITTIEKLSSGTGVAVELADLEWTREQLSTEVMAFLEEVTSLIEPSRFDAGSKSKTPTR